MRLSILCMLGSLALVAQDKPARVSGHVRRVDTGEPLAKAIVTLHPQDEGTAEHGGERVVSTGADGAFVLGDVGPGAYAIEAERNGFVFKSDGKGALRIQTGEEASNIELRLAPAAVISGVVLGQDDEPVQDLTVMALRLKYLRGGRRELSGGLSAVTDDQSKFRLYDMGEGLYYLRTMISVPLKRGPERSLEYADIWYPENAFSEDSEPLRVIAGAGIRGIGISVRPEPAFSIAGRVEGYLKSSETLRLVCARRIPFVVFMFGGGQEIRADGSFTIEDLQAGEYVLEVGAVAGGRGRDLGFAEVSIVDRNVRVNIPVGQAAEVSGTVTEEGTDVLPKGLQVSLYESESVAAFPSDVDKSGGFDIRDVRWTSEFRWGIAESRSARKLVW
jgi:Carboxypeptidase regulatory-like domain